MTIILILKPLSTRGYGATGTVSCRTTAQSSLRDMNWPSQKLIGTGFRLQYMLGSAREPDHALWLETGGFQGRQVLHDGRATFFLNTQALSSLEIEHNIGAFSLNLLAVVCELLNVSHGIYVVEYDFDAVIPLVQV